ncbi:MAG: DASS family sodium-coupled anion symporter [bacterium]|nr:DASS family sodium-coupled anion symporter [bacterium]
MTLRPEPRITTFRRLRFAILIGALVVAAVLLFGGAWVRPIHAASGQPFDSLADHPQYAEAYLSQQVPQRALVVFIVCLALWVTNLIPMSSTGLLALTLLPLLGVTSPRQSFAYFGNSAVFFIIGVFVMAAAMIRTGLSKRLTLIMLQRFDRHPRWLAAGVLGSSAFLAMWMPAHAVAAMMLPIILEVADSLSLERLRSGYAKVLFFALAWGAIIGGVATFLGGARAPLALELLHETFVNADGSPTHTVSFLGWMKASMPLVVILTGVAILILFRFIKSEVTDITPATQMLNHRVAELGPMSKRERRLALVGLITIGCWIFLGHRVNLATIALGGAVAISALRIADWRFIQEFVNWGVVIMYGGAIALGSAMEQSHAVLWVAQQVLPSGDVHPMWLLTVMVALTMALSSTISNAAAVAVLLPVGYALCGQADPAVHPLVMTYAIGISSGLAFALPISSPPTAICYASGYYRMIDVPRYGIPLTFVALLVFMLLALLYWPLVGIDLTAP